MRASEVERITRAEAPLRLPASSWARIRMAADVARQLTGPIYGRSTGVGANHGQLATSGHGLRLLRSHAAGAGPSVAAAELRAMLVVRVNQLAAGGSGISSTVVRGLLDAVDRGLTPPVRRIGAIGTGDLTALAITGLCLVGERAWNGGTMPPVTMEDCDALPLISSSAATIGAAALHACDIRRLLDAMTVVAALSVVAAGAALEPFDSALTRYPGQGQVAELVRKVALAKPRRQLQDSYAFRALAQINGAAVDAWTGLDEILTVAIDAASENPLIDVVNRRALHNGNFHTARLAGMLDALSDSVTRAAAISTGRLASLSDPAVTGLPPFLAAAPDGSSGIMILEYVAHGALASMRGRAAVIAGATLSLGVENDASFASQATERLAAIYENASVVVACELIAAVRALRLSGHRVDLNLPVDLADRPLDGDIDAALALLPTLGRSLPVVNLGHSSVQQTGGGLV